MRMTIWNDLNIFEHIRNISKSFQQKLRCSAASDKRGMIGCFQRAGRAIRSGRRRQFLIKIVERYAYHCSIMIFMLFSSSRELYPSLVCGFELLYFYLYTLYTFIYCIWMLECLCHVARLCLAHTYIFPEGERSNHIEDFIPTAVINYCTGGPCFWGDTSKSTSDSDGPRLLLPRAWYCKLTHLRWCQSSRNWNWNSWWWTWRFFVKATGAAGCCHICGHPLLPLNRWNGCTNVDIFGKEVAWTWSP